MAGEASSRRGLRSQVIAYRHETIPQRVADLVFFSDLLLGRLGVGSVSEVNELGWGLRDERYPPPDQVVALARGGGNGRPGKVSGWMLKMCGA